MQQQQPKQQQGTSHLIVQQNQPPVQQQHQHHHQQQQQQMMQQFQQQQQFMQQQKQQQMSHMPGANLGGPRPGANFPIAAPRNSRGLVKPNPGGVKHGSPARSVLMAGGNNPAGVKLQQYYPNLSGSETDVSTSTENLTQEERFLLRHMEREEPQGEENQVAASLAHFHAYINAAGLQNMTTQQQISAALLQQQQQQQLLANNAGGFQMGMSLPRASTPSQPVSTTRMATPTATPTYTNPMTAIDSSSHASKMLQDEIWASKIAAVGRGQSSLTTATSQITPTVENKLNPSVYSHPSVEDPVLMSPKSYPLSVLSGKKPTVDMTSSGAFFDPKAVTNSKKDFASKSNDGMMITHLGKEMHMDNTNMHNLLSGNSDGSNNALNNPKQSQPISSSSLSTNNPRNPSNSSSSGYRSESSFGSERHLASNQSLSLVPSSTESLTSSRSKKTPDKLTLLSRSQPDLFTGLENSNSASRTLSNLSKNDLDLSNVNTSNYINVLEVLQRENLHLRAELEDMTKKVEKVGLLEQEMSKIQSAYQGLLKHSEKRETLEKAARQKLQNVIINLTEVNKEVTERHETVMAHLMSGDPKNQNIPGLDAILRGEIMRKDGLITQLMNQNKMLMSTKERQDAEMSAQQETLEEQRSHIQILDTALSNSQAQILRLEEETSIKDGYADRVKQMTRSLEQLQAASEKREAMEKKLRAKLEEELKEYRDAAEIAEQEARMGGGNVGKRNHNPDEVEELRRKFNEAEERIIRLESERTQWEQRYLEESAMRQVAIDAASIPKDAKILALEKNSAESEKIIAEARSEKMKQLEDLQTSQRKMADMDSLIKTLETSLAEQTAMVRILQTNHTVSAISNLRLPQQQPQPQQQLLDSGDHHMRQMSQVIGSSPSHVYHAKQLSTPIYANKPTSPALSLLRSPGLDMMRLPMSPGQVDSVLMRSPASAGLSVSHTDILRSSTGLSVTHTDILKSPASSNALEILRSSPLPAGLSVTQTDILRSTLSGSAAGADTTAEILQHTQPLPYHRNPLHLHPKDLLQRSLTPNIDLLHQQGQQQRSATPTADLLRSVTPTSFDLRHSGGRRDSAPGEILALKNRTTNNTSGLLTNNSAIQNALPGSSIPKPSLRDNVMNRSMGKFSGQPLLNPTNNSDVMDDSIDSIMAPSLSHIRIDTSPRRSQDSESKSNLSSAPKGGFMEVWRV